MHERRDMEKTVLTGAAALLALCGPAFAQTGPGPREVIVVRADYVPATGQGALKADIPLLETPQSVSVVTRDQIDLLDWSNLSQTARYAAGVTGENYGPDERVDWLTLRGFEPVQYVDGLQASIGSIANTGLDLYGAELVQILKGPASALYGLTPPGGIVNITSRRPEAAFGGEIEGQAGSHGHRQVNGDVTGALSDTVSGRLTALWRERGTQVQGVDTRRVFIAPAASFRPGPDTSITVLSYWQDDEITGDGGGFLPAEGTLLPNPNGEIGSAANLGETSYNRFAREHYGIGYEFEHAFANGLRLSQNLKYTDLVSDQRGLGGNGFADADFDGVPDDYRTVNRYSFSFAEDVATLAADTRLAGGFAAGGADHEWLAGLDWRRYDYAGASAFDFAAPPIDVYAPVYGLEIPVLAPAGFADQLQTQTGLYAMDRIRTGDVIVTLAGRHDWVETEDRFNGGRTRDRDVSYTAGLTWLAGGGFAPYASVSRSFQPAAGADAQGDAFDPTTGEQMEAGVKYERRTGAWALFASAAAYQLTQANVLTPDPDPANTGFSVQTGEVRVRGFEAEAVARFDERLSLNASYSYADSEVTRSNGPDLGAELPMVPGHTVSALADYAMTSGPLAGFGAGLGVRHTSASAGNLPDAFVPEVFTNPAVTLVDASVRYETEQWRAQLTASNLFDREYVARCYSMVNCFYGTRRTVTASLARRF
ncbi:TonB-dependent siderophore receptor [Glycocaulis profundi]|nr:TonB-dependent siderophore receptor [Glycocaulis profundi]